MAWIKLDDQWMDHPKIIRAGRDARDVWLASITWCAKHLTDGYFPEELLPTLCVMAGVDVANCQQFARILLDVCLWEATDIGYYVHDYLDYNPTKEQTEATKMARKRAGRAGGAAKAAKTKQNASKMPSKTLAKSKQKSAPSPSPFNSSSKEEESQPNGLFPLAAAMANACRMDLEANKGRLLKEAKILEKASPSPTPELIGAKYGPGGWWYLNDWRGKRGEAPSPATIRETWGRWVEQVKTPREPKVETIVLPDGTITEVMV